MFATELALLPWVVAGKDSIGMLLIPSTFYPVAKVWQSCCPQVWGKLVVSGWKDQRSYGVVEADWGTSHCRRQDILFSMSPSFPEKEAWGQSKSKRQKWGQAHGERQPERRSGLRTRQKPEKARISMSPSDTLHSSWERQAFDKGNILFSLLT